jgi:hypothetical protein
VVQGFLWQVLVVQLHVAQQRFLQVFCAVEMMRTQNLLNPAVEAFDHSVGLRRTGPCQSAFESPGRDAFPEVPDKKPGIGRVFYRGGLTQTTASCFCLGGLMSCSRLTPSHMASGLATSTDE